MRLALTLLAVASIGCGGSGFTSETKSEKRTTQAIEDGRLHDADDSSDKRSDSDASSKHAEKGSYDPASHCPLLDQATIDKLIASGKSFEVECELEIELGDD